MTLHQWGIFAPPSTMVQFVVYDSPADAPGNFVVRPWVIVPGYPPIAGQHALVFKSLEAARAALPEDMVMLSPSNGDDPCIAEVWL
jgi:hypothetical protein